MSPRTFTEREHDGAHGEREALPADEAWETFASLLQPYALGFVRQDLDDALFTLERCVEDDVRPTTREVRDARMAIEAAQHLIEEHYAPVAAEGGDGDS